MHVCVRVFQYRASSRHAVHPSRRDPTWKPTNLYPNGGSGRLQVLLGFRHQDGLVAGEHRAVAVCGRVPLSDHDPGGLHGYGHSLGAVQAVGGVIKDPARIQAQAQAVGGPHPAARVPRLVVGVLGGLGAALSRDGDEGFGSGTGRDRRRGLLIVGRVGDGWKR